MIVFDVDFAERWRDLEYTRELAKDTATLLAKIAATQRPAWWSWTVWLGCAITCARIEAVR